MRLIDADKLNEEFQNHYEVGNPKQNATMDEVCMMLFHAQTVDAVPVVRCRECKYRGTDDCIFHIKGEPVDEELLLKLDNDFCSYGERKGCAD